MSEDAATGSQGSATTSDDESSQSEAELMITNRERRRTAGNRYSQVVAQEQADEDDEDDVALLFAEAEGEDEEYNSDEADDEADMSSSDDDDQGPNAANDDMEGEQELVKQAKAERQKKRKADLAMTTMSAIKKKPKIDPTSLHRAPERPKPSKRRDRESWLPISNSAPGRSSARQQTVAHREDLMQRLKVNEAQRLKHKAQREALERKKQAEAPKQMTQEDRLVEAAKIERRNAKSLNRWETMEKQRVEEQAARLAALKDRKMDGAVITFHSSKHTYRGPRVEVLTPGPSSFDDTGPKKRGPKPGLKAFIRQQQALGLQPSPTSYLHSPLAQSSTHAAVPSITSSSGPITPTTSTPTQITQLPVVPMTPVDQSPANGLLAGINDYASQETLVNSKPSSTNMAAGPSDQISQTPGPGIQDDHRNHILGQSGAVKGSEILKSDPAPDPSLTKSEQSAPIPSPTSAQSTVTADLPMLPRAQAQLATPSGSLSEIQQPPLKPLDAMKTEPIYPRPSEMATFRAETLPNDPPLSLMPSSASQIPAPVFAPSTAAHTIPISQLPAIATNLPAVKTSADNTTVLSPITNTLIPPAIPTSTPLPIQPQIPEQSPSPTPAPPIETTISNRNLLILQDFETLTATAREAHSVFYNTRRAAKPPKHVAELCAITGLPAKYKDPVSGVGYANVGAFKKLKVLREHGYRWSGMLGCYVGKVGQAARGVPEGFVV